MLAPAYLYLNSLLSLQAVALWDALNLLKSPCLRVLKCAIVPTWNTLSSFLFFFPLDFGSKPVLQRGHRGGLGKMSPGALSSRLLGRAWCHWKQINSWYDYLVSVLDCKHQEVMDVGSSVPS